MAASATEDAALLVTVVPAEVELRGVDNAGAEDSDHSAGKYFP